MAQEKFDINTYSTTQMHLEQQLEYIPQGIQWLIETLTAHMTGKIKACYVVVHDKDISYDEDNNPVPVAPHVHIALHFHSSAKVKTVLGWFGWEEQPERFQKAKKNSHFGSLISYLCHRTPDDKHKYQYDPASVITITGEPYPEALQRVTGEVLRAERVKHGQTAEQNADKDEFLSDFLPKVANGTIAPYNLTDYVSHEEYVKYRADINKAMEYKEKQLALEKDRDMQVFFVQGASKSGKTTVSKELACLLFGVRMKDVFVSSGGKNPLDDYGGEPIVILDDLRPSDFKFNDLLKLLDNDTASLAGCRYYNKSMARCRAIFITSTIPLHDWYKKVLEHDGEAIGQLARRVQQIADVVMNEPDWSYTYKVLQPGYKYVEERGADLTLSYRLTNAKWIQAPERRFLHVTHYNKESTFDMLLSAGKDAIIKESDRAGYQFSLDDNKCLQEINENETDDELPF